MSVLKRFAAALTVLVCRYGAILITTKSVMLKNDGLHQCELLESILVTAILLYVALVGTVLVPFRDRSCFWYSLQ